MDTATLTVSRDTILSAAVPSYNYGTLNLLYASTARTSLIKSDITAGVTAGSHIRSAILYLKHTSGTSGVVSLHRALKPWIEGTKGGATADAGEPTWSHQVYNTVAWATAGCKGAADISAALASVTSDATVNDWHAWDITAYVQSLVNGLSTDEGLVLIGDSATASTFHSREATDTADRPYIVIESDPPHLPVIGSSIIRSAL